MNAAVSAQEQALEKQQKARSILEAIAEQLAALTAPSPHADAAALTIKLEAVASQHAAMTAALLQLQSAEQHQQWALAAQRASEAPATASAAAAAEQQQLLEQLHSGASAAVPIAGDGMATGTTDGARRNP